MQSRPSFAQYGVLLAKTATLRSEDIYTKAACVAFDKNWYTLGSFYNGFLPKQKIASELWEDRNEKNKHIIHAENWLISRTNAGEVYRVCLNISPCSRCSVLLAAHGVKEVYYELEYHREQDFKDIFKFYNMKYQQVDVSIFI